MVKLQLLDGTRIRVKNAVIYTADAGLTDRLTRAFASDGVSGSWANPDRMIADRILAALPGGLVSDDYKVRAVLPGVEY